MKNIHAWSTLILLGVLLVAVGTGCSTRFGAKNKEDSGVGVDVFNADADTQDAGEDGSIIDPCEDHCSNQVKDCGETGPDCGGDCAMCPADLIQLTSQSYLKLGRELVVLPITTAPAGMFLSWRSVPGDVPAMTFEIRRSASFNEGDCATYDPIYETDVNSYLDTQVSPDQDHFYCVQPMGGPVTYPPSNVSRPVGTSAGLDIALTGCGQVADVAHKTVSKVIPADLNGDGCLDFLAVYCDQVMENPVGLWGGRPCNMDAPNHAYLEAFIRAPDGRWSSTWCKDMSGVSLFELMVWDFNADGKAEIAVRHSPSELGLLSGETGLALSTTPWPWSGFAIPLLAYLDGVHPNMVMQHSAWAREGPSFNAFEYDALSGAMVLSYPFTFYEPGFDNLAHIYTHGLTAADIDGDGRDEVIPGPGVFELEPGSSELTKKWAFEITHTDMVVAADFRPEIEGLETFVAMQEGSKLVAMLSSSGTALWEQDTDCGTYEGQPVCYWSGWEKGWCGTRRANDEILCYTLEMCEGNCMSNQGFSAEDSAKKFFLFDPFGNVVNNNQQPAFPYDWSVGEGIRESVGHYPLDILGDSREEYFIERQVGHFTVSMNSMVEATRYITPLADPTYLKTLVRQGVGYHPNFAPVSSRTFVLTCSRHRRKTVRNEWAEFVCAVSSLYDFDGDIRITCAGDAEVDCLPDQEDIAVPANGSVLFEVHVRPSCDVTSSSVRVLLSASSDIPLLTRSQTLLIPIQEGGCGD